MPVLLRGLKDLPVDLTAVVTVADDGGVQEEFVPRWKCRHQEISGM